MILKVFISVMILNSGGKLFHREAARYLKEVLNNSQFGCGTCIMPFAEALVEIPCVSSVITILFIKCIGAVL